MAIKKLQNNFTTPEQSKRLLELGVPASSADCYFGSYQGHPDWADIRQSEFDTEDDALFRLNEDIIPCWSVGRLIEIIIKCEFVDVIYVRKRNFNKNTMDKLIEVVERCVKADFDFSKLEE